MPPDPCKDCLGFHNAGLEKCNSWCCASAAINRTLKELT